MSKRTPSEPGIDAIGIAGSWAIVVGAEGPWLDGVTTIDPLSLNSLSESQLVGLAQPGQLWILVGDHIGLEQDLRTASAVIIRSSDDEIFRHLAEHAAERHRAADERLVNAMREIATTRRELNTALSALSARHPVLGLMPSVSQDQFRSERQPAVPLKPRDPNALMTERRRPNLSDDEVADLQDELRQLRQELEDIQSTRLVRWTAIPRMFYRSIRGGQRRHQRDDDIEKSPAGVTADRRR